MIIKMEEELTLDFYKDFYEKWHNHVESCECCSGINQIWSEEDYFEKETGASRLMKVCLIIKLLMASLHTLLFIIKPCF